MSKKHQAERAREMRRAELFLELEQLTGEYLTVDVMAEMNTQTLKSSVRKARESNENRDRQHDAAREKDGH